MHSREQAPPLDSLVAAPQWSAGGIRAVAVIGIVALVCMAFSESTRELIELWLDTEKTTYTHGLLLSALSAWLIWRRRQHLAVLPLRPSIGAASVFVACALIWLVAVRAGIQLVHLLLLPALMGLAVVALLGSRAGRAVAFPLAFLYFAIPAWDEINSLLQGATVIAVDLMIRVSGIPAYVEGNVVHLAAGSFEVAGGCSGLHFFMVGLSLGALYGELHFDTLRVRLKLFACALFLSLLSNWIRVYSIIVAGYLTDMQHYLVRVEHYRFGWFVFAVMMAIFFWIARRMPAEEAKAGPLSAAAPVSTMASPRLACALSLLAVVPIWNVAVPVRAAPLPSTSVLLPSLSGWAGPASADEVWQPVFAGADQIAMARYAAQGEPAVERYVAMYGLQQQEKELVGYGNSVSGPRTIVESQQTVGDHRELVVRSEDGSRSLIRFAYGIGSVQTSDDLTAQLAYGVASIRGPVAARVEAQRTPCTDSCDEARARLTRFAAALAGGPRH